MKPKFNSHAWQRDGTCKDTLFLKTIVNPADTIDKNGYIDTCLSCHCKFFLWNKYLWGFNPAPSVGASSWLVKIIEYEWMQPNIQRSLSYEWLASRFVLIGDM